MSTDTIRQAVILAGGRGTRLGALTHRTPKPLVAVAGRPFLDWQIEEIVRFGIERITLLAGYKAEQIVERYSGHSGIEVLVEGQVMGTAGALALFAEHLDTRFLCLNGDTLFPIDLRDLAAKAEGATATLALRHKVQGGRYGTVDLSAEGNILGFHPPSPDSDAPINAGLYVLDREIVRFIEAGRAVSLESEVFPRLVSEKRLRGVIYDAPFIDIGIPADFERAQTQIPAMVSRSKSLPEN